MFARLGLTIRLQGATRGRDGAIGRRRGMGAVTPCRPLGCDGTRPPLARHLALEPTAPATRSSRLQSRAASLVPRGREGEKGSCRLQASIGLACLKSGRRSGKRACVWYARMLVRLMTRRRPLLSTLAAAILMVSPSHGADEVGTEELHYRWKLSGLKGVVVRLFIPGQGEGTLTTGPDGSGSLVSELRISSASSRRDDYWLYGSEIDANERRTVRAWSSQKFRGKSKGKQSDLERDDVVDLASSIFFLRQELPEEATEANIWSGGRIYRVSVKPHGRDARLVDGRPIFTRSYSLRASEWFPAASRRRPSLKCRRASAASSALAGNASPLEIAVSRDGMRVRLELIDPNS